MVGWLVWVNGHLSEGERKNERNDKRKKYPDNPIPTPAESTVGLCQTIIQISRTP